MCAEFHLPDPWGESLYLFNVFGEGGSYSYYVMHVCYVSKRRVCKDNVATSRPQARIFAVKILSHLP
jgi:hypothetical protein